MRRRFPPALPVLVLMALLPAACGDPAPPAEPPPSGANEAAADVVAYLAQLGLIRGHLRVGMELYRAGRHEHAKRHMKHPEDELYASLADSFARRGATGFAGELSTLAALVERDADGAAVDAAYEALLARIAAAGQRVAVPADRRLHARVAASLLDTAAEEYAIGIVDGQVSEVHEYQDAWGFTQVAIAHLEQAGDDDAMAAAGRTVAGLAPLWPALVPEGRVAGDAGRIEAAGQQLEDALRR